jgi:hypothetical protein
MTTTERSGIPEVKFEGEGIGVSVGQVYSQEVTFKSLRPTIVGTGLQAADFGWSIRDEMLEMSAKRLIAIIGVPKNTLNLELQMVITMKTKAKYFGAIQGDVASGRPQSFTADLHQR